MDIKFVKNDVPVISMENKYEFIITTHPTLNDLKRAEKENKLVLCFISLPPYIKNEKEARIWSKGYIYGCGINESSYLAIYCILDGLDTEIVIDSILKYYSELKPFEVAGFTSIANMNIPIFKKDNDDKTIK